MDGYINFNMTEISSGNDDSSIDKDQDDATI